MIQIVNDEYLLLKHDEDTLYFIYRDGSEYWGDLAWKQTLRKVVRLIEEEKIVNLYADRLNCHFIITPDLQEWVADYITPKLIEAGLQKYVQVLPHELFSKVSGVQLAEESLKRKLIGQFEIQFFENRSDALKWIGKPHDLYI